MVKASLLFFLLAAAAGALPARAGCFVSMDCGGGYGTRKQTFSDKSACESALSQARSANGCDNVQYDCGCSGGDSGSGGAAAVPYDPNQSFGNNVGAAATGVAVEQFSTEFGKWLIGDPERKAKRAAEAAAKADRERQAAVDEEDRKRRDQARFQAEKSSILGEMKGAPQEAGARAEPASGALELKDLSTPPALTEKTDCTRKPMKPVKYFVDAGDLDDPLWVRYLNRKRAWCALCDPTRSETPFCTPDPDEPSIGAISNESRHPLEQPGELNRDDTRLRDITSGSP